MDEALILIGASVRAAAFSALRAGLTPWCADLFGDLDLKQRCPCEVIPPSHYPDGFLDILKRAPAGPVVYTGALENARPLLTRLGKKRTIWGNTSHALVETRTPSRVVYNLRRRYHPAPDLHPATSTPPPGRWLLKPIAGAAGAGIRFWDGHPLPRSRGRRFYLQQFIEGESGSGVFLGEGSRGAQLLGVTRQLVGETWLHAAPFRYCGSIGPWPLSECDGQTLINAGTALARAAGLRGLFGIDFVLGDGVSWPVEVNPRYTASIEVLEHATNLRAMALHRDAFTLSELPAVDLAPSSRTRPVVGKAIYYAPRTLTVPDDGPWTETLRRPPPLKGLPDFADIPAPGQVIKAGRPVLTFFARALNAAACRDQLRRTAATLDRVLGNG